MSRLHASHSLGIVVIMLLCVAAPAAGDVWISIDSMQGTTAAEDAAAAAPPRLHVTESTPAQLAVSVQTTGVVLADRAQGPALFVEIGWPEAAPFGDVGAPQLPVVRELFIAPPGAEILVDVKQAAPVVVDAEAAGGALLAWPRQAPVEKIPGAAETAPFAYDAAAYGVDASLPAERVVVQELGILRDQRLCLLEVRPVAYNAAARTLTIYPDVSVDVRFVGGQAAPALRSPMPGLQRCVLNPEVLPQTAIRGTGTYLVVVSAALEAAAADFIAAKADEGFTVLTYVPASATPATIKSYIKSLWDGGTDLQYVLLIGDTNTIGAFVGGGEGSPDTDLPYVCMDGTSDWYPDIAIGRFPARTAAQLQAIVDKTLYYMDEVQADDPYLKRAVFMSSSDRYYVTEATHNWCINTYMIPNGYTCDKLYSYTYNATTQQVRNAFNNGRFFGIYSGHGATTYWADGPVFMPSDVNGLTNYQMYSFICSFSCITGTYTATECFMETWVLAPAKGAVCAWGSSVNSYWDEDDILQRRLFDVIFDADPNAVVKEAGPIYNETKLRYLAHYGPTSTTRRYLEMYNLMGDPSVWLFAPPEPPTGMKVSPREDFYAEGPKGGPFEPATITYALENKNETPLDYAVTTDVEWLSIDNATGTIPALGTAEVLVSVADGATLLGQGYYTGALAFANVTDGDGNAVLDATLKVGVPTVQYEWTLDADPGWSCEGQWAWGRPQGRAGDHGLSDPTGGYTGTAVYGYNLAGGYANGMPETHLTSAPIDCTDFYEVSVSFYRWLGVEQSNYDKAYFRVSNDGVTWVDVWKNGMTTIDDHGWVFQEFDISAVANDQPTVYLRWTMGRTDLSWTYCGWNVDDVQIKALAPEAPEYPLGDLNCSGQVDFFDIDALLVALGGEAAYAERYPDCEWLNGDMNGNGTVDFFDIDGFLRALGG